MLEKSFFQITQHGFCNKLGVFSPFEYEGITRLCIKRSKYNSKQFAALKILALYGAKYAQNLGIKYAGYTVVPIPMNKHKLKLRGFNQAGLIANALAKTFNLPIDNKILFRVKETSSQYTHDREERYENMKEAFKVDPLQCQNKAILLVDDICTSGATLLSAAEALYRAGVNKVVAFTLTRRL